MSRELKFRVWFKPTHEYKCEFLDRYGSELPDLECSYYTSEDLFDDTWIDTGDYSSIVIEQFTGLKDKNGKEVYEGDIVKETIVTDDEITQTYEVYWDEDTLCWGIRGTEDFNYNLHNDLWETNMSLEIIGNIHEKGNEDGK